MVDATSSPGSISMSSQHSPNGSNFESGGLHTYQTANHGISSAQYGSGNGTKKYDQIQKRKT